jgi:hypothetical protein
MSRYTPPCQWDLACVRDAGHDGDHLYPTPDTKPQPSVLPDGAEDTAYEEVRNRGGRDCLTTLALAAMFWVALIVWLWPR